ncbi:TonB-dependent receptor-like protein [Chitinophaga dinghuensis]|uniref:TonB-dependent receptor-like protein n=1 Tax=Chitinophaga dinghuensis TaxID=1539050 RepID=A0A327VLL7_9BACT|nr:TonB-dependent receptor [Chitinophaga dinghuensis]RAJ75650.1 TonB-dependent receptor-like protein [Chitinophaga dinghuensis]
MNRSARFFSKKLFAGIGFVLAAPAVFAQVKKDSVAVQELKDDIKSNIPVVVLDENDADNNTGSSGQSISSILYGGRDPYYSGVFNFNVARFRLRGYDASYFDTYINGAPVKNLTNGYTSWSLWGGLNDVMHSRVTSNGLRPVDFGFGDIGGANYIDIRASKQRKELSVSYAQSNRNYNNRVMASWSSGMLANGWAFSLAGSFRYAGEGYVQGTYYNGASYYASVDKKINKNHLLSFTTFGTPTATGGQSAATQEMYDLAGSNFYNPSWGYQQGKQRSANYTTTFQPFFILSHDWTINNKSSLKTAVSYNFGERARTVLDWYNAPDPRPDYYRNLPSYATDPAVKDMLTDLYRNNISYRQVNWDNLYDVNRHNTSGMKGVPGNMSRYILEDRVTYTKKANFNTVYNTTYGKNHEFTAGLTYNRQEDRNFERVNDLLGGDYFVNLNQFAERDFPGNTNVNQYDVDNPNRILKKGDEFGYNYTLTLNEAKAFAQTILKFDHFDFFLAGNYTYTSMWRTGNVRNGLYPDNSKGKSDVFTFNNVSGKGGVTYKIDGRNYIFANAAYTSRAPFVENVFISPRNRNTAQGDLRSEKILDVEAGYVLNWEKLKFRLNGYYTNFKDGMDVLSYYDDSYQNLVNYALTNIGKEHYGMEIGVEAPIYKGLSVKAAANIGRYYYNSRQNAVVTVDNSSMILANETVYSKNYRIGQTPQEAYTVGLNYQGKKYWFANLNFNYFDQMWVDMNPIRRTERATSGVKPGSDLWKSILGQEQLPSQYTVDIYGGKTFSVRTGKTRSTLVFTAGINNLLNNTKMRTGGFEQLRFDYTDKNVNKFPAKYYYAYGLNYFVSLGLRM